MQQLLEVEQNVDTNAAQARVTPQELVQATAAIEARHHARAQHDAATIPIGEAVQQLNLEATPEELLAEVQTQRNAQMLQTSTKRNTRPKSVKILAGVIAFQAILIALLGLRLAVANQMIDSLWNTGVYDQAHIQTMSVMLRHQQAMAPASRPLNMHLLQSDKFRTLDIPVGQTIQCRYDTIENFANNANPAHIYTAKKMTGTTWQLAREADGFYVNCWAKMKDAEQLLNGREAVVYATKAGAFGEQPDTLVKIPINSFQNQHIYAETDAPAGVVINGTH